ncbi:Glu-tRNA(Gln) amidotransferase subunit GatD [Candidatus Pacearchaeota archaeon]|nr:Glu-tRNA(Gln) amidotransferase subunit GatD [Candidatus Pacearchaeota archaeon]MBI2057115.1 Glu-tRNA(Gln) amidotransferase subunit GatD [Candidatus Pacearchaeota archaeon]
MKSSANPGDLVEVHLSKTIYEGTLLESSEKGIVLLKLDTGYNIGFNKKDILEIKVLKKASLKTEKLEIKKDFQKPNIALILTGGTIANRYDSKTGAVAPLSSPEELFKFYPEIFEIANVAKIEVPFMKASEDMDYKDWQKIAKITKELLNDSNIKGVIVAHGTDTLHYTSSALSFFIKDLNKPVVLTYSQRSSDRASSDAALNLKCSALAAISDIAEVMLVGHGSTNDDFCYAMPGTKVRKLHSSKRDAFKVVNAEPFAKIFPAPAGVHQEGARTSSRPANTESGGNRIEILREYNLRNNKKVKLDLKFEEKIALLKFYPGQDPNILNYYLKNKYKGIIIEASGLGHVPALTSKNSWIPILKEIVSKGIFVGITTQCIYGRVDPYVYSNLRKLHEIGALFLEDMLAETAFVKLGWVLGHPEWNVKEKMLENISGELNDRLGG